MTAPVYLKENCTEDLWGIIKKRAAAEGQVDWPVESTEAENIRLMNPEYNEKSHWKRSMG